MIPNKSYKKSEKIRWIKQLYQEILTKVDREGPNGPIPDEIKLELYFLSSDQETHLFLIQKESYQPASEKTKKLS